MALHWDIGRNDEADDYQAHVPGDINLRLAQKCIDTVGIDVSLFYVSRRHILEIVPELTLSALLILPAALTLPLVIGNLFVSTVMVLIILAAILFFLFELWRWDNEILFVSQAAIARRRWNWAKFQWDKDEWYFGAIVGSRVVRPLEFNFARIQAGSVTLSFPSGDEVELPLTPSPYKMLKRVDQATRHGTAGHQFAGSSPWLEPTVQSFRD